METLEVPVVEESEVVQSWPELPPSDIAKDEMDAAAFELWREGSRPDACEEEAGG